MIKFKPSYKVKQNMDIAFTYYFHENWKLKFLPLFGLGQNGINFAHTKNEIIKNKTQNPQP